MEMPELAREVTVQPAFDCIEVQPCVKGSDRCGTEPGANHGRGGARIHFALYSPVAEVRLVLDTGWQHTATPNDIRGRFAEMNLMGELTDLGYHSAEPIPGIGPIMRPAECPRGWATCWSLIEFGKSQPAAALLVDEGSDAVWAWLEQRWRGQFAPDRGTARHA